jgi:hypothetical protein
MRINFWRLQDPNEVKAGRIEPGCVKVFTSAGPEKFSFSIFETCPFFASWLGVLT